MTPHTFAEGWFYFWRGLDATQSFTPYFGFITAFIVAQTIISGATAIVKHLYQRARGGR